jgi:hypothetical protein
MNVFSEGEVIVRDDLKYPDGALVVDGLDEEGCMLAHPLGGGFQLVVPPENLSRFQRVEAAETIEVFSPGTFSVEGTSGKFEGWSDGSSWNGWERPCFTREVAERILEASGHRWSYDPSADEFTVFTSEDDDPEQFKGESIQLGDGGSVTAYFVGAGAWIWEKI